MKKTSTLLTLLLAGMLCTACNGNNPKAQDESRPEESEAQTEATRQVTPAQQAATSEKGVVTPMDKSLFRQKIYDFEKNHKTLEFLSERPAVIDFYADWCGPCKRIAPILQELAGEYAGKVDFYKVDVDKETELSRLFQIQSIPLVVFVPLKGEAAILVGAHEKGVYQEAIDAVLQQGAVLK